MLLKWRLLAAGFLVSLGIFLVLPDGRPAQASAGDDSVVISPTSAQGISYNEYNPRLTADQSYRLNSQSVTLDKVYDHPSDPHVSNGFHQVDVKITAANTTLCYHWDSPCVSEIGQATLIGSNGEHYIAPTGGPGLDQTGKNEAAQLQCPDISNQTVGIPPSIPPGRTLTFCMAGSLAPGVTVAGIQYRLIELPTKDDLATWTVSESQPDPTGRIVGLQLAQKPTTPLWNLDLQVSLANTQCPATVTVASAGISGSSNVQCNGSAATATVRLPVFKGANQMTPATRNNFTVTVHDASGKNDSTTTKGVLLPPAPIWVGIGDSYSSGHHQIANSDYVWPDSTCLHIPRGDDIPQCGLLWNDSSFSWVSKAVNTLNAHYQNQAVPVSWQMQANVIALSGAETNEMVGAATTADESGYADGLRDAQSCDLALARLPSAAPQQQPVPCDHQNQMAYMQELLGSDANQKNSWNVVSMTGGANDTSWVAALTDFYSNNHGLGTPSGHPWGSTNPDQCVNYNALAAQVNPTNGTLTQRITKNLLKIMLAAHAIDPNAQLVDVYYAYGDNQDGQCFYTHKDSHGTTLVGNSVIADYLNAIHKNIDTQYKQQTHSKDTLQIVDTQQLFGMCPLTSALPQAHTCDHNKLEDFTTGNIQKYYYYGYPHVSTAGQTLMGQRAAQQVLAAFTDQPSNNPEATSLLNNVVNFWNASVINKAAIALAAMTIVTLPWTTPKLYRLVRR